MKFLGKSALAITVFMATSTALVAQDIDDRVAQLENDMQQVYTTTAIGTCGARTASARVDVDGYGWFLTADVLYWHAKVGGTEYAYTDNGQAASYPIKGRTKDIGFDWDWGLRVGIGYNLDHDNWDIRAQYTWFDSSGSDSTGAGNNSSVIPLRGSAAITGSAGDATNQFIYCTSAKSMYDFDYSGLDVEMGRAYFVSKQLSFRPYWGLKAAWFDLKQTTRYTGGDPANNQFGLSGNTVEVEEDCDFWGLGPRLGIDSRWHLGYGFSFFGNIAGALLFGHFDVDHKESFSNNADARIKLSANRHAFSPQVQMQLGLRYDKYICCNKQHLGVALGYEANYWWRQNQVLLVNDGSVLKYQRVSEDVSMHGLTFRIKWDF